MTREITRPFETVTIVGVGLIGGSLALALKRAGFAGKILGVSSRATLDAAIERDAIDEGFGYDRLVDAAAQSDLIVLCTPILTLLEQIDELGRASDRLRAGTIVTDVGSTKGEIVGHATTLLPSDVHFIGGHPLAGSEFRGIAAADPFLFQNAYYVLTPGLISENGEAGLETSNRGTPGGENPVDRLAAFISTTGARVVEMSAERHDRIAAAISHVPQLLAVALVESLEDLGDDDKSIAKKLAAGGFRNMTRIASSPFSVWKDILQTNRVEISAALRQLAELLHGEVAALDLAGIEKRFDRAAKTRGEIPKDTKGFLSPLWDVLVEVEDKPGMIYGLVQPLFDEGINIKDIEVLKVRETEGGSMRLAFAKEEDALRAMTVLGEQGFVARLQD